MGIRLVGLFGEQQVFQDTDWYEALRTFINYCRLAHPNAAIDWVNPSLVLPELTLTLHPQYGNFSFYFTDLPEVPDELKGQYLSPKWSKNENQKSFLDRLAQWSEARASTDLDVDNLTQGLTRLLSDPKIQSLTIMQKHWPGPGHAVVLEKKEDKTLKVYFFLSEQINLM